MNSLKDTSIICYDFSPAGQFQQVSASILLIQQSFQIQIKKLQTARKDGIINNKEYGQWLECLDSLKRGWFEKDFTQPENVIFLKFVSTQYYQTVIDLTLPVK